MLTDREVAELIKDIAAQEDPEGAHKKADEMLCDVLKGFGYRKTVEAFREMEKWYS